MGKKFLLKLCSTHYSVTFSKLGYPNSLGCPINGQDWIFPSFRKKSENLGIKTHPDQILDNSEHKSSFINPVEVLLLCS